ncbi:MAG: glycosyltransferase [Burkholderiaceae bacterium]|nr:glycosyltransferase [Burkholderiaceae bacterium]
MSLPTFSIVTCTWNSEPWLAESITSVLRQRGVEIEYIFVDGGSNDGTLQRIRAIDRPVTLIENVRGGISRAMNAGIEAARGDIVAHLHSDDFYLRDDVLQTVAEAFAGSGCRWLFGRTMTCTDGKLAPEGYVAPRYSRRQLLRGNFIPHPATFVARELMWRAGGFSTDYKYAMDYDLWLRMSCIAEPLQLDVPLAAFREHAGSLSTRERSAAMLEDLRVRLVHTGFHPMARAMHVLRYVVRRQRARLSLPGGTNA